jgi:hypothetical protein
MALGHAKGKKIVNRLRHSYLNIMKLENCGPIGECLKDNGRPHFGILIKNQIKYYVL